MIKPFYVKPPEIIGKSLCTSCQDECSLRRTCNQNKRRILRLFYNFFLTSQALHVHARNAHCKEYSFLSTMLRTWIRNWISSRSPREIPFLWTPMLIIWIIKKFSISFSVYNEPSQNRNKNMFETCDMRREEIRFNDYHRCSSTSTSTCICFFRFLLFSI